MVPAAKSIGNGIKTKAPSKRIAPQIIAQNFLLNIFLRIRDIVRHTSCRQRANWFPPKPTTRGRKPPPEQSPYNYDSNTATTSRFIHIVISKEFSNKFDSSSTSLLVLKLLTIMPPSAFFLNGIKEAKLLSIKTSLYS